ncbi:hypothetical protein E8E13_000667, partial [Curvularia kusanoi]
MSCTITGLALNAGTTIAALHVPCFLLVTARRDAAKPVTPSKRDAFEIGRGEAQQHLQTSGSYSDARRGGFDEPSTPSRSSRVLRSEGSKKKKRKSQKEDEEEVSVTDVTHLVRHNLVRPNRPVCSFQSRIEASRCANPSAPAIAPLTNDELSLNMVAHACGRVVDASPSALSEEAAVAPL